MSVPLTLAFVEATVVRARERLYAVPIAKVFEVFKAEPGQLPYLAVARAPRCDQDMSAQDAVAVQVASTASD